MTVWIDGNVNGEYSDDMRLSPMIEILNNGTETGTGNFTQLRSGGEIVGFEVSLHVP